MNKTNPIGLLDYASEGLDYVKTITLRIPNERLIYYNNIKKDSIANYAEEGVELLIKKNAKVIVIVSQIVNNSAIESLRKKYQITFIPFCTSNADVRNIEHNLEGMGLRCPLGAQAKHEFYVNDKVGFIGEYKKVFASKPDYAEEIKSL